MEGTAKLFKNGRSQAVRLPKEFRFEGTEVRIRRVGNGVLLEPKVIVMGAGLNAVGELKDETFKPEGMQQPDMATLKDLS